jgi:LysM repeat protein
MRTHTRCILSAAVGVLAYQPLSAQEAAPPRTHTVVRGDNLWDLSQRYLGNAFLWPEIYRLNRDVVEDPHWIYPGEILRLPGDGPVVAAAPGVEQPVPEAIAGQPAAPSPVAPNTETVFRKIQRAPTSQQLIERGADVGIAEAPTVRSGEVLVAPYVDREGGPRGFGRILKSGDITGIGQASDRERFQVYDRIFIAPPVGQVAPEGERYLAYRLGPVLEDQGQVIIPTGIIEVTKAARSGVAAGARVVRAYRELSAEDRLIPIDTAGIGTTVRPRTVPNGPVTTIKWVYGEPVLPSVQSFVVLGLSSEEGVKMGDEFLIYLPQSKSDDDRAPADPEIPISRVQVVRSTPYGVTAVVLGQEQPAIKEGMNARVIARMP